MLVFEILECGLYHEKKRYICMSKVGRNVVKTRRYDSVLSPIFFLNFNLIKTAAKFMWNESVKCPARAVFAKSRARHVHIMSLNLVGSPMSTRLGLPMNHYYTISFFLQKNKTLCSLCGLRIPANIVPRTQ